MQERYSILYVDDEEANLNVFKATFKWDYTIYTATSGEEGLALMQEHPIDLVVTDQKMPRMDGVAFLKKMTPLYPDVVKIILTGYSESSSIIEAINECGIYRYISKPWDEQEMRLTLQKAFEHYRLQKHNQELIRELSKAKEELERKVEERTAQVSQQKAEIEKKNKELEAQNELLQQINHERNGIIGIAAHDLNSPLRRIKGLAMLMAMLMEPLPEEPRMHYEQLMRSVDEGTRLIKNILYIKSDEENPAGLSLSPIDVVQVLKTLVTSYQDVAKQKDITLSFECDASEAIVFASDEAVVRIFDNLVSNAIKFSPYSKRVFVSLKPEPNAYVVKVKDEGPGILPEDRQKMFKRFQKLSASPTAGETSSGLGLSIVYDLVTKLNGTIEVESRAREGATFIVHLPALKEGIAH